MRIALAIFRQVQKNEGRAKQEADDSWRALGPEGRAQWRRVAKAAVSAFKREGEISSGDGIRSTEKHLHEIDSAPPRTALGVGRIVLGVGVYDNADILSDFLDWHLALGIDFVVAFDYGSVDGSQDILEEYRRRGVLDWRVLPDQRYLSFNPFLNIAKIATDDFGAEWVAILDPDEFLCVDSPGLRGTLELALQGGLAVVTVPRCNMTGPEPGDAAEALTALTLRVDRGFEASLEQKLSRGQLPFPSVLLSESPKVIVRGDGLVEVGAGSHSAHNVNGAQGSTSKLRILHYPFRGYAAFARKAHNVAGWLAANPDLPARFAWHWRRLAALSREGLLEEEFRRQFVDQSSSAKLIQSGVCCPDRTVAAWKRRRQPAFPGHLSEGVPVVFGI